MLSSDLIFRVVSNVNVVMRGMPSGNSVESSLRRAEREEKTSCLAKLLFSITQRGSQMPLLSSDGCTIGSELSQKEVRT